MLNEERIVDVVVYRLQEHEVGTAVIRGLSALGKQSY